MLVLPVLPGGGFERSLRLPPLCGSSAWPAEPERKSGYAIGSEQCGGRGLSFPRIKLDMKKGFCAGLVLSDEDGLRFPRSIVQIPGHEQFVISDMGGWNRSDGRLLLLDPRAAEGRRLKEIVTNLEYPFGLAIGPDKKVYASTHETIFRLDPLAANHDGAAIVGSGTDRPVRIVRNALNSCRGICFGRSSSNTIMPGQDGAARPQPFGRRIA